MSLFLTLSQPPPQLLPLSPLEASHTENHQERGCPVTIFFNILTIFHNTPTAMEASHPKSHIEQGYPETIFLQYPTVYEQYPALFYILPRWKPPIPLSTPISFFLGKVLDISGSE